MELPSQIFGWVLNTPDIYYFSIIQGNFEASICTNILCIFAIISITVLNSSTATISKNFYNIFQKCGQILNILAHSLSLYLLFDTSIHFPFISFILLIFTIFSILLFIVLAALVFNMFIKLIYIIGIFIHFLININITFQSIILMIFCFIVGCLFFLVMVLLCVFY